MRNLALAIGALALVGGGIWYLETHKKTSTGGGGAPGGALGTGTGSGGGTAYSVDKWHVAAVTSPYGQTVFNGKVGVADVQPGQYVLFALAYGGANDPAKDPTGVALGKVGAVGTPTASGKKVVNVTFKQIVNWNSNYSPNVPPPPPGTDFACSTDDIATVYDPANASDLATVQTMLGTA